MLKRRIIACAYSLVPSHLLAGGVACSQICMINSPVPGEHLENNQGIQRQFSTLIHKASASPVLEFECQGGCD